MIAALIFAAVVAAAPNDLVVQCQRDHTLCTWIHGWADGREPDMCEEINWRTGQIQARWPVRTVKHRFPNGKVEDIDSCDQPWGLK